MKQKKLTNILILEDNEDCVEIYNDLLRGSYNLTFINKLSVLEGINPATINFNLLIADMKVTDGVFLDWIVTKESVLMEKVPSIIVSSIEDLDVLRDCFQWGAMDYIVKPFRSTELIAKIEKILSKRQHPIESFDQFQSSLTLFELKIFNLLHQYKNYPVTREFLVKSIWKKVRVNSKTLDVHLSNIRQKMVNTTWKIETLGDSTWRLSSAEMTKQP